MGYWNCNKTLLDVSLWRTWKDFLPRCLDKTSWHKSLVRSITTSVIYGPFNTSWSPGSMLFILNHVYGSRKLQNIKYCRSFEIMSSFAANDVNGINLKCFSFPVWFFISVAFAWKTLRLANASSLLLQVTWHLKKHGYPLLASLANRWSLRSSQRRDLLDRYWSHHFKIFEF